MKIVVKQTPLADAPVPRQVDLLETNKPRQERAIRTYEAILAAASELLVEVGMERISTNLIAERAGVTVPALYRYFPNKYAVLNALGARLMDLQNKAFLQWHEQYVAGQPPLAMMSSLYEMLHASYEATNAITGGLQIMYCMQLAPLQQVRLESHWALTELFGQIWCEQYGVSYTPVIETRARIAVDIGYTAIQLALEDPRMTPEIALREGAQALRLYLEYTATSAGVNLD
jgi:AcrR family transcriptional regulator